MKFKQKIKIIVLKPIALFGRMFPKFTLDIRYWKKYKEFHNWKHPQNTQIYAIALLFKKGTDVNLLAKLADKVAVREFVKERIGEQYLTKLYGTWESVDKIDFNSLPSSFVIKTNHGCGNNFVIRDKSKADLDDIRDELDYWLHFPYGDLTGQIHYSRIKPMVLAEEFLEQEKGKEILPYDYKFFCYKGKPLYVLYYEGRKVNSHIVLNGLYDMEWNPKNEALNMPVPHNVLKPVSFEEMKGCVEKLCAGFEFVRVDFYEIGGRPVFGEMTFTPDMKINLKEDFAPLMKLGCEKL